ncbi:MAG: DUF2971 domain-containing protein [Desulfobacteraceae bacterium]|nr:DUF2971 domain-containing protein [Desulfobacteraceae bacterium]
MEKLLYHYTNREGLIGIIESKSIWASKIQYLNDIMEFKHAIEVSRKIITDISKKANNSNLNLLFSSLNGSLEQIRNLNIFVASLSEESDLLSQWRGYCQNGSGYSIGFSKRIIEKSIFPQGFTLSRCIYDQNKQKKMLKNIIKKAIISIPESKNSDLKISKFIEQASINFVHDFEKIAPFIKHPSFSEEKEWRIASNVISSGDTRYKFRIGKTDLIPYVKVHLSTDKDILPIRHIVVGPGPNENLSRDSVATYLSNNKIRRWSVNSSRIPYRG